MIKKKSKYFRFLLATIKGVETLDGFVSTPPTEAFSDTTSTSMYGNTTDQTWSLRESVRECVKKYIRELDGQSPKDLWKIVAKEVEVPLIRTVLEYTNYNQSKAAVWLGISRGTLRKKMAEYDIDKVD